MLTIKSYIFPRKGHVKSVRVNNLLPGIIIKNEFSPGAITGAIEIFYNGRSLLNIDDFWGLIGVTWSMILDMVSEFLLTKAGYAEILECGARFEIMWIGDNLCAFTVTGHERETIIVSIDMLLRALLEEADLFFSTMKAIFQEQFECDRDIELLSRLKFIIYNTPQSKWWSLIIRSYVNNPNMEMIVQRNFEPYVEDSHWIDVRNDDAIGKVKDHLSKDKFIGFVYIEYKNTPLTMPMAPGRIDRFAISCMMMIMNFVSGAASASMTYENITITLAQKTDRLLNVSIVSASDSIEYTTPSKPFLEFLLSTSVNILYAMRNEDYKTVTVAHYSSVSLCIRDLGEKIDLLFD